MRYLAIAWAQDDSGTHPVCARACGLMKSAGRPWENCLETNGLAVFVLRDQPSLLDVYRFPEERGVVVGRLFRHEDQHLSEPFGHRTEELDPSALVNTGGNCFTDLSWGAYVAFIAARDGRRKWVHRDPGGGVRCHYALVDRAMVFCNCIEDLAALVNRRLSIDWKHVAHYLYRPGELAPETGLEDVFELKPGERLLLSGDASPAAKEPYWDPATLAADPRVESAEHTVERVRDVVSQCVAAWASCFRVIVHLLSGGLDSSIVLRCLRASPSGPEVICLNHYDRSASEADEREYAKLAANAAGCELLELEDRATSPDLRAILTLPRSATPTNCLGLLRHGNIEREVCHHRGASIISCGVGGDQVFFRGPIHLALADRFVARGPSRAFMHAAYVVSRMTGQSFWNVLGQFLRDVSGARARNNAPRHRTVESVVSANVQESIDHNFVPRDLRSELAKTLPPGKRQHVMMIARRHVLDHSPVSAGDPQRLLPLYSQPLLETMLRIPTPVLTEGGWDRALARRAFDGVLPHQISRRREKGGIDTHFQELFSLNLPFLRELLLDGTLVGNGLVDRRKLELIFSLPAAQRGPGINQILCEVLSSEAWACSWRNG